MFRTFSVIATAGFAAATTATVFTAGQAPHCEIDSTGHTVVHFTAAMHPSFKCTRPSATTCTCAADHPTHHDGSCRQFDHIMPDGTTQTHKVTGDCSDAGLDHVDGGWSGWTYGTCSKSCGTGTQSMTRTCTNPAPFHNAYVNGAECTADGSSATSSRDCNTHACPVDGVWSSWAYGTCSKSCGTGTQSMTRTCDGRDHGGADCAGSTTSSQNCNTHSCPVDGTWSGWTYGTCTKNCGTGTQSMTRTCNGRANGGADCAGSATSSQNCNTDACPVDGTWSGWTTSSCSTTCGDGTKTSTRTCDGQAHGGADCVGSATQTESCNEGPCVFGTDAVIQNDSNYMNNLGTVGTGTNLWWNRNYAVEQLPDSVKSDTPYYQQSGMSTEICSKEGGGLFNTDKKTSISICCANHGAANNIPTGLDNVVTLGGVYSISNHGGTPCTYYTGTVEAGSHHVCCATGWASGLFYPVQPSSPPVVTRSQSQMVSVGQAGSGTELWWNRNYAIEQLPSEVTSKTPYYVKSGMSTEICSKEGGGLFHTDQTITVSICCANHGAANNIPTGLNNVVTLSGVYSISNHGGTPCTYYQGTVNAGSNHVCCATGWASGVFLPVQAN